MAFRPGVQRVLSRDRAAATAARSARLLLVVFLVWLAAAAAGAGESARVAAGHTIAAGFDLFETQPGTTTVLNLPAGFFGTGSEAFRDTIPFQGVPIGYVQGHATGLTDTIVHRLDTVMLPTPASSATIPIEITALSLQSVNPITIQFTDGSAESWVVNVAASTHAHPHGTMTIYGHDPAGGTFNSTLPVVPVFTFTQVGTGEVKKIDFGLRARGRIVLRSLELIGRDVPYTYDADSRLISIPGLNRGFCAGCVHGQDRDFVERAVVATHKVHVARRLLKVPPGYDLFETLPSATRFRILHPPIPPGFFDPGSDAFTGTIALHGQPIASFNGIGALGNTDTIVHRTTAANFEHSDTAMVPIELVALSLESVKPIIVMYGDGHTEEWTVAAHVSTSTPSKGTMTMTKLDDSGGTFSTADFTVYPVLVFTRVSDGLTRTLDLGSASLRALVGSGIRFKARRAPWQRGCRGPALIVTKLNKEFCPALGRDGHKKLNQEQAMLAAHGVKPAQPPKLPPVDCLPEPMPKVPQGASTDATCMLDRHEFIDSFFDEFVQLEPQMAPAGLDIGVNPAKTALSFQEQKPETITVSASPNVPVGMHTVRVKVSEGAGSYLISSFFDVVVDVTARGTATLQSITVTPPNPTVIKGQTQQFTATGHYSDGSTQDQTKQVTWVSSNTGVATISNSSGSQGLSTAQGAGDTTISASLGGVKGMTTMTVPVHCNGTLAYNGNQQTLIYQFQCDAAISRIRLTFNGVNISHFQPPTALPNCTAFSSDGTHQDGEDCTGSLAENTGAQGMVQTAQPVPSGAGGVLDATPTGSSLQMNVGTLSGPT